MSGKMLMHSDPMGLVTSDPLEMACDSSWSNSPAQKQSNLVCHILQGIGGYTVE